MNHGKDHKTGIRISGFTIVRNASLLDYPFVESVLSTLPLCDEFVINCGDCSDNTHELCNQLLNQYPEKIRIVRSVWDLNNQKEGFQLKSQTDRGISLCRGEWCLYIQADEVLHQDDHALIRNNLAIADRHEEVDGLLFDYVHFYGSYDYYIRGRNWYRKEVRLFKNRRDIYAFRDAQGFRKSGKRLFVIPSRARIFHYGYVRSPQSLKIKSGEMVQWWGEKPVQNAALPVLRNHIGLRKFLDSHPSVMKMRISQFPQFFKPDECKRVWTWPEINNALTLAWEAIFPFRLGEFKNYKIVRVRLRLATK